VISPLPCFCGVGFKFYLKYSDKNYRQKFIKFATVKINVKSLKRGSNNKTKKKTKAKAK